jgi:hypothetical protein
VRLHSSQLVTWRSVEGACLVVGVGEVVESDAVEEV